MLDETHVPTDERIILRRPEVQRRTGLKRAYIYKLMREKKFPQAVPIGLRAVGWYSDEIAQWIVERGEKRT
ncbi:AlpA family phage regulatory protein [Rahnella sp. CG8]|uniref:AlpA family phage regulatory protein n=1 Tax=Yersiniaceae TaxID=1903411 RepID=UPI001013C37D|nr:MULTISPECIES: AlpA family phage regulatory protein [Yersiniaceae]MCM2446271.1 AlpA family phage regulatory protein [Rahnella sp. CG8]